jgi:hypothetical protein
LDKVELSLALEGVKDLYGEGADGLLVVIHSFGREWPTDEPSKTCVIGRVHLHHRASRLSFLRIHILESDSQSTRENVGVATGEENIVVLSKTPESSAAVGFFGPVNWVVLAKITKRVARHSFDVSVV